MYGVPLDEDWSFLLGKELGQLCIGPFDVQLHFSENVCISMQGDDTTENYFSHKTALPSSSAVKGMPGKAVSLVSLPWSDRANGNCGEQHYVCAFSLSNLEELRLYDSNDSLESFTINGGPNGVIVV